MPRRFPSFEFIFRQFRTHPGLYILGGGASAGAAPFGQQFWAATPLDYLRHFGGFPATIPAHGELTQKMIAVGHDLRPADIFPDRAIRSGSPDFPHKEILLRLPDGYVDWHMRHLLAKWRFSGAPIDSYRVFRDFCPSVVVTYNHDGLAAHFCAPRHRVIDMHGTTDPAYGSQAVANYLELIRDYGLPVAPDGLLMGIAESHADRRLARRLQEVGRFKPAFIAIIGYSFARLGDRHDDQISLDFFLDRFADFTGDIFIIEPRPDYLRDLIADHLGSPHVFGVPVYWNLLAHAGMEAMRGRPISKSLSYAYEMLLDCYGNALAFPIRHP